MGTGNAKVTITFDSWKDGAVASTQHEIPVVAPRSQNLKLETVSSRLKGELIHPNKTGELVAVQFSPDGKRVIAGDYPGGVVTVWDVATGKQLTTIETGYGYRAGLAYFAVSPDWRTLFAWREKRKPERVELGGKRMIRWTFDGSVRTWNLDDGKLVRTYKQTPPHNIRFMQLSPSGEMFYTHDELPGTYERGPKHAISLWDVKTGTSRTLDRLQNAGRFSPDGRTLSLTVEDEDGYTHALKLIEAATGREQWSVPIRDKNTSVSVGAFSRDSRLIFGAIRIFDRPKKWDRSRSWMKWWDAATGREVASIEGDKNDSFTAFCSSPDDQMLAALNWQGVSKKRKLYLYSVADKRLLHTIIVGEKTEGQRPLTSPPVFSPDGKWLAVITRSVPEKAGEDLDPRDVPQPRILLIETATGEIRETLIAPQSFANVACFSPDGRTLATDGHGRVLLWDMTKMPQ